MKSIVILITLCFVAAAVGHDLQDKITLEQYMAYRMICVAETGVEIDTLERMKKGEQVVFDDKVNCYAACMLKKIGIMTPDGIIDEGVARSQIPEHLPQDKVDKIINACKAQVGKDSCETGGMILKCILDNGSLSFLE